MMAYRVATWRIRSLPDFIIIGAQRCGTTSLYEYLIEHPCVAPAFTKEVHFFDINFGRGVAWYRAHFPSLPYKYFAKQIRAHNILTGEATPYYIFHPHAPKRVSKILPRVKLIALLRNPVDRAYSHYHLEVRNGAETLSFEDALEREAKMVSRERERITQDENYQSLAHQRHSYLSRGIYVDQLEVWESLFPREQILVLRSEDFDADPATTLRSVLKFLNLPSWEPQEYGKYHQARYPKMDPATRRRLVSYFEPHNQSLYEFLGVNFEWD